MREYLKTHKSTPEQKAQKADYMKKYSQEKSEELSAYQKERWLRDKDKILIRKQKRNEMFPEIRKAQSKKYWSNTDVKLRGYQRAALNRNLDFSLSTEEFNALLSKPCHYCGSKEAMGVDRKDNTLGYYSYNVVSCCKTCNFMKGTLNYDQFIQHIASILDNLS